MMAVTFREYFKHSSCWTDWQCSSLLTLLKCIHVPFAWDVQQELNGLGHCTFQTLP